MAVDFNERGMNRQVWLAALPLPAGAAREGEKWDTCKQTRDSFVTPGRLAQAPPGWRVAHSVLFDVMALLVLPGMPALFFRWL